MIPSTGTATQNQLDAGVSFLAVARNGWGTIRPGYAQSFLAAVQEGLVPLTAQGYADFYGWFINPGPLKVLAQSGNAEAARGLDWILAANIVYRDLANETGKAVSAIYPGLPITWSKWQAPDAADLAGQLNTIVKSKLNLLGSASSAFLSTVASPVSASIRIPTSWIVSDTTAASGIRTVVYDDRASGKRITVTGTVPANATSTGAPQPVTPTYAPRINTDVTEFVVTRSTSPLRPGFPKAPGDGIHFPVLAWRIRTYSTGGGQPAAYSFSPWIKYGPLMVNRTSSETTSVIFAEDMSGPELDKVAAAQAGGPPPVQTVDVLAAPSSTSLIPVREPPGVLPNGVPNIASPTQSPIPGVTTASGPSVIPSTTATKPTVQPFPPTYLPPVPFPPIPGVTPPPGTIGGSTIPGTLPIPPQLLPPPPAVTPDGPNIGGGNVVPGAGSPEVGGAGTSGASTAGSAPKLSLALIAAVVFAVLIPKLPKGGQ